MDKKLSFEQIEGGMIFPHQFIYRDGNKQGWGVGGVLNSKGEEIPTSFVSRYCAVNKDYRYPFESIQQSSETVIYLGMFFPAWGHAITDCIRRMWFIKSDVFKREFKQCPLVCVLHQSMNGVYHKNFRRFLELLGIENVRIIKQPVQFAKVIMPQESYIIGSYFTNEFRETIDRVRGFALKNCTPTSIKKIYYYYGARQIGEERLAEYFKTKGYEIIRPETLTLDDQLNLLINCESFASTAGSCSHNSLFLRDGTEAIFIPRVPVRFTPTQIIIDAVNNLNANYVDSSILFSDKNYERRPYCYIISKQLKRFFGDKFDSYEEEDFKAFLQYMEYVKTIEDIVTYRQTYCREFFKDFLAQLHKHEDLLASYKLPPNWEKHLL